MYRIRFHGRGGQGMKTASRILGTAFFFEGFEVQDAPRYGAERRGAPIFAYVRADRKTIFERGVINNPGLIIVADDSLVGIPAAGVLHGIGTDTVVLIHSREHAEVWQNRLNLKGVLCILPATEEDGSLRTWRTIGAACSAAAAQLTGVVSWDAVVASLTEELSGLGGNWLAENLARAQWAYDQMSPFSGCVKLETKETAALSTSVDWIDLPCEEVQWAAPAIHTGKTSEQAETGLWRTLRPVIDSERCKGCWWLCSTFCPDGAIQVDTAGRPQIDYAHCKGCLVCVAQCPAHAIDVHPEHSTE
ncbi:MAG: 2-oxoacid:acceptor oxidoreductase family protein [Deltaproteobacteria bacterium]|jgi:pyruvate ferredoxin oxidoreductase gamma subunit|nr:2-oxoacid:acceptor oxidoreductase family protein [Deltaproteobacteria bacterium]